MNLKVDLLHFLMVPRLTPPLLQGEVRTIIVFLKDAVAPDEVKSKASPDWL